MDSTGEISLGHRNQGRSKEQDKGFAMSRWPLICRDRRPGFILKFFMSGMEIQRKIEFGKDFLVLFCSIAGLGSYEAEGMKEISPRGLKSYIMLKG